MPRPQRPARATARSSRGSASGGPRRSGGAKGRQLVIVESPAKAKTINKYLGPDFVVAASVGHVRDLPEKARKGAKEPVPGVDLEHDFRPTYEVLASKRKTMAELKRAAREAAEVWFATDLDREGEAIAWHLAEELGIPPERAKRVIFNAITRSEIERAFQHPHPIDQHKVNAQQARRILDRIVGYQVSPLLWKKVARGLSAGRVQSVAVRLIVEREREIAAFVPEESWRVAARLTPRIEEAGALGSAWEAFAAQRDERGNAPTLKAQAAWLAERGALEAELVEVGGRRLELVGRRAAPEPGPAPGASSPQVADAEAKATAELEAAVRQAAEAAGLVDLSLEVRENPEGRGPQRRLATLRGRVDPAVRYRVRSVETRRTQSRAPAPFITSTLQVAASNALGFGADRTMRIAQALYEGVEVPGTGHVGLITYMRTDSTHLSADALREVREYIRTTHGDRHLPEKPNFFGSSNKQAQEAHEAIRPTDVTLTPESVAHALTDEQLRLYRLIWNRFVASQMTPAEWDATVMLLERADKPTGAVLKANGRVLVFDGWYRVGGVPAAADEPTLPRLEEGRTLAPFSIEPQQRFSSPPPRYTEASLVKKLEEEGIGRPSTYASIIKVVQDRGYVEQIDRRFRATDLGIVVTDKLVEGFPRLMDVGYTREMEAQLDKIEEAHADWVEMLHRFYGPFRDALGHALETMSHAKAEIEPAPFACPECGRRTCYRFGKNGRFLSCSGYPECKYAAPIDRQGRPLLPERVNLVCPEDGGELVLRQGRFGPFIASPRYPEVKFVLNVDKKGRIKLPAPPPLVVEEIRCDRCGTADVPGRPMNLRSGKRGPWLGCSGFPKCRGRMPWTKLDEATRTRLEKQLAEHEKKHPPLVLRTREGKVVADGTPVADLLIPGEVQELAIHPEAKAESDGQAGATSASRGASSAKR